MEIVKTKLQIILGIVICVLIYMHFNPPKVEEEAVTMEMVGQKKASFGKSNDAMSGSAQLKAQQIMSTGDVEEIQSQMNEMGLLQ